MSGNLASTQLPAAVSNATYNANNQLTQWGSTAMTYDLNGNTLNDGMNSYTWDARNRLVSANSNTATFGYDPLGRRIGKTILAANTNFLYDGVNPVQELNGTTVSANLLTGGIDEHFTRSDTSGTMNYLTDALGSTTALANSSGSSTVQYSYSPFGSISITGTTTNSFTYTGREIDGLGINYYRARYYNPQTGRFISEDPIGLVAGINNYAYVGNSPLNFVDPFGLDKVKCASQFGKDHSIASLLGMGDSYAANLFLGNSVSGLADLGESVFGNGGPPDFLKMTLRGASQGIPINDIRTLAGEEPIAGLKSITGTARSAILKSMFDAATESGSIPSIAAEGGEIAAQGGLSAGEFASGIGIAKFGYDALSFGYGYFVACSQ